MNVFENILENQQNNYNCGAVCVQWVFKQLFNKNISQSEVEELLKTSKEGTSHADLLKHVGEMFPSVAAIKDADLKTVKNFIDDGYYTIVGWTPEEEHYSILMDISDDEKMVLLNDPGSPSCISIYRTEDFLKKWFDTENGIKIEKWAIFIQK